MVLFTSCSYACITFIYRLFKNININIATFCTISYQNWNPNIKSPLIQIDFGRWHWHWCWYLYNKSWDVTYSINRLSLSVSVSAVSGCCGTCLNINTQSAYSSVMFRFDQTTFPNLPGPRKANFWKLLESWHFTSQCTSCCSINNKWDYKIKILKTEKTTLVFKQFVHWNKNHKQMASKSQNTAI